jgi:hypothetical protein
MLATSQKSADRHLWTFSDNDIIQLAIDPTSLRISCGSIDAQLDIRLESPFLFEDAEGTQSQIDPDEPHQIAPMLSLIGVSVIHLDITSDGTMEVRFGDGSWIRAQPDPADEAWEVDGTGTLKQINYLCSPGGGSPWSTSEDAT